MLKLVFFLAIINLEYLLNAVYFYIYFLNYLNNNKKMFNNVKNLDKHLKDIQEFRIIYIYNKAGEILKNQKNQKLSSE
jgi:hypothetical protein